MGSIDLYLVEFKYSEGKQFFLDIQNELELHKNTGKEVLFQYKYRFQVDGEYFIKKEIHNDEEKTVIVNEKGTYCEIITHFWNYEKTSIPICSITDVNKTGIDQYVYLKNPEYIE